MKRLNLRTLGLVIVALLMLVPASTGTHAQANSQVWLAYVDTSGNVWLMTPGNAPGTQITKDADFKQPAPAAPTHNYAHLRWSPDGGKLTFQDAVNGNLYIVSPGGTPLLVASGGAAEYPPAWLPDNTAVAYVTNTQQAAGNNLMSMNIQQVAVNGGQSTTIGNFTETQGCGGGGGDQASALYAQETAFNGNYLTFAWTKAGWLYSPTCTGIGLALNNTSNQQVWHSDSVGRVAVSRIGGQAAGISFDANMKPSSPVLIDLPTGRTTAINTGPGVDQIGWSADEALLLYSTIDGQTIRLWKMSAQGGQPTLMFSDTGRYIGVIDSSPDSQSVLISFIAAGDNPQTQILSMPMNGASTSRADASVIAQGGEPAYNLAPPAINTAAGNTAANCTPRADWVFSYTIQPGDTLASLSRRTNTGLQDLATGNCLANPNLIFVGEVLRVPTAAQPAGPTAQRIVFQAGAVTAVVQGQLAASGGDTWVLKALGGQTLTAQLTFSMGQAILVVWGADGTVLMSDHAGASNFTGALPSTQDYFIAVRGNPGGPTNYTLTITVPPLTNPNPGVVARRIVFAPGAISAVVTGQVANNFTDRWVIKVQAGQTMTAQVVFSSGTGVLIVFGADGNVLQSDHAGSTTFTGTLPTTQDYNLDVRANGTYTLTVTIPPLH